MGNSKLILGTVQMGLAYGINNTTGKPTISQAHEILKAAYDSKIRFLDTAEAYGNAHQVIGDFHRKYPTNIFEVITKISGKADLSNIEGSVRQYLDELHVEQLHALMFHSFDAYNQHKATMPLLKKMKAEGNILYLGVSIYNNDEFAQVIKDEDVDLIQLPFNLLDNAHLRGELIAEAKKQNKIIHTRSAFLQGLFFKNPFDKERIVIALHDQLMQIRNIADEYKIAVTTMALGYCLHQHNIDNVLIGVDSIQQLRTNLMAQNDTVSDEVIRKIDAIRTENPNLLNPSSWN